MKIPKKIKLIIISLFLIISVLAYTGLCFKKAAFLSDADKIKIAIEFVLSNPDGKYVNTSNYYKSYEHFYNENPDCCVVIKMKFVDLIFSKQLFSLLFPYIFEPSTDVVYLEYVVDIEKQLEEKGSYGVEKNYIRVSNCGNAKEMEIK